jgi:hypothetical protein
MGLLKQRSYQGNEKDFDAKDQRAIYGNVVTMPRLGGK